MQFQFEEEVTVTFADDQGQTHTVHGVFGGYDTKITTPASNGGWHHERVTARMPSSRQWVTLGGLVGHRPGARLPAVGRNYEVAWFGLCVCLDEATVTPLTTEGEQWVLERADPETRITRLLAKVTALDKDTADMLRAAIEERIEDVRFEERSQPDADD